MPVPKRKVSRARRDSRSANKGIKPDCVAICSNCDAPCLSHQACMQCGFYKGRKVIATKLDRGVKRAEVRSAQAQKAQDAPSDDNHEHENEASKKSE